MTEFIAIYFMTKQLSRKVIKMNIAKNQSNKLVLQIFIVWGILNQSPKLALWSVYFISVESIRYTITWKVWQYSKDIKPFVLPEIMSCVILWIVIVFSKISKKVAKSSKYGNGCLFVNRKPSSSPKKNSHRSSKIKVKIIVLKSIKTSKTP